MGSSLILGYPQDHHSDIIVGCGDKVGLTDGHVVIYKGAAENVGPIEGCSSFTNSISVSFGNVQISVFPAEI